jgi:hypothetical protein
MRKCNACTSIKVQKNCCCDDSIERFYFVAIVYLLYWMVQNSRDVFVLGSKQGWDGVILDVRDEFII